jgi:hypothetical protein
VEFRGYCEVRRGHLRQLRLMGDGHPDPGGGAGGVQQDVLHLEVAVADSTAVQEGHRMRRLAELDLSMPFF